MELSHRANEPLYGLCISCCGLLLSCVLVRLLSQVHSEYVPEEQQPASIKHAPMYSSSVLVRLLCQAHGEHVYAEQQPAPIKHVPMC